MAPFSGHGVESTLLNQLHKSVTFVYVGETYSCAKFCANLSTCFPLKWVKYICSDMLCLFIYLFIYLFISFFTKTYISP